MAAKVVQIRIFPLKSCDGFAQEKARVLPSSALQYDRQFALIDSSGSLINAKRHPRIHQLNLQVDPIHRRFQVAERDGRREIQGSLDDDGRILSDWLSDFFSLDVSIIENGATGFPDDLDAAGPTIVSTATLQTVADWFEGLSLDEVRRRFRANIEVGGVEPFWEDRLVHAGPNLQRFRIGKITFIGVNPCPRCVVPTRDSQTGKVHPPLFSQQFAKNREATLPDWADRSLFPHYYRLSTNTRLLEPRTVDPEAAEIQIGDLVEVLDSTSI